MQTDIRAAGPHEVAAAAAVLAEAFVADPVLAELAPDRPGVARHRLLTGLFTALVRSVPAHARALDVAVVADGSGADTVVGASFWEAPHPHRGGTLAFLRQVPAFLRVLGVTGALRAAGYLRRMQRARPGVPHWYLGEVGVAASARGTGVGGRLIDHALARVDRDGGHAYLESSTPRNRRLYRRLGFTDGPPLHGFRVAAPVAMWRPAGGPG
ncbi:GNAT family N-acetyltransferase [Curtobacterium aetherium]|uniref:GNAT family N-acetyltransferase n=1 Tax=Curtobacterium aetherium TaxID=2841594 RepID=UPI003B5206DA